jgi:hypothetical protein
MRCIFCRMPKKYDERNGLSLTISLTPEGAQRPYHDRCMTYVIKERPVKRRRIFNAKQEFIATEKDVKRWRHWVQRTRAFTIDMLPAPGDFDLKDD